jgi:hypothetical protein
MKDKLQKYMNGEIFFTPIMNIMINNRSKDWYAELGKYIDESIDISKVPDFAFYEKLRPKKNIATKIKDFLSNDSRFYFGIASMFITSTLDASALKKMFGEPVLHNEFGEGFDGDWNEDEDDYDEPEIKESHASYFVNVDGHEFHIGYDHRGPRVEVGLDKKFNYNSDITNEQAEKCLEGLKKLFDLYKEKCL